METFKKGEVTARIDERGIDLGNINVNLYTMDNSTSVLDIHIKKRNIFSEEKEFIPVNLNQTKFRPVLHLITEDNSIFTNEELEIVKAEEGHVRYNVSDYVTKHVGRVQAKLFLIDEDSSTDDSSHVADFYFKVNDSGLTKAIGKEIHVDMLDDIVERILLKDIERFRGPQGDKGDPFKYEDFTQKQLNSLKGDKGDPFTFEDFTQEQIQSLKGDKGDPFTYEDFTQEQLDKLKPELPNFSNWQKYKLTNDDGTNFYDANLQIDFNNNEQLTSLPIGTRYVVLTLNNPSGTNSNGWLTKYKRDGEAALIQYQPYNSTVIYQKRFYRSWSDWERVGSDVVDTGWLPLPLINGVSQAGTANQPKYKLVSINNTNLLFLKGAVNGISANKIIFSQLPKDIVKKIDSFMEYTKASINSYTNTMVVYNVTLNSNGELILTTDPNIKADRNGLYYIDGILSL
ncbi:BppU family phage baseplate upper protein [Staphylococcus haemolyticus]|uniref:BppU family phage baseplate upper protein n=1 Tax=Staphylococcus haemolyticus TaxID=1283 RepID=UPI00374E65B9